MKNKSSFLVSIPVNIYNLQPGATSSAGPSTIEIEVEAVSKEEAVRAVARMLLQAKP